MRAYTQLDTVVNHIEKGNDDIGLNYILTYLTNKIKDTYPSVAKETGVHISSKMNEFAAGAMWTAAGVTQIAAQIILCHFHTAFGCRIQTTA